MDYPRTIVIEEHKLKKLLQEKAEFILRGREKSEAIDLLEAEMDAKDKEIQEIEKSVDLTDIKAEAEVINKEMERVMKLAQEVNQKTFTRLKEKTVVRIKEYEELKKKKENLENERNKFALKANQKTDKIIPLGQKLMRPFIMDEWEDYDTLCLENGEVTCTIFSHIEDFKKMHRSKKK